MADAPEREPLGTERGARERIGPPRPPLLGGLGIGIWIAVILLIVWGDWLQAENWRSTTHLAGYPVGLALGVGVALLLSAAPHPDPRRLVVGCLGMILLVVAIFSPRLIGDVASGVSPAAVLGFAGTRLVQILRYRRARRGPEPPR
jgi:hypothetical protein